MSGPVENGLIRIRMLIECSNHWLVLRIFNESRLFDPIAETRKSRLLK